MATSRNQTSSIINRELQQRNTELEIRNAELEALQEVNRQLRGPIELPSLTQHALNLAIELTGSEGGTIRLLDEQNQSELYLIAEQGFEGKPPQWAAQPEVGRTLSGWAFQQGQPVLIEDINEWLRINPGTSYTDQPAWVSGLFMPLIASNQPLGVLGLAATTAAHFTPEKIRFTEMIAGQIATAVQQVSRRAIQKKLDQLSGVLTLARTVAHELNDPLAILKAEVDIIIQLGQPLDHESFERMSQAIEYMGHRVRQYQKIMRFETTEPLPGLPIIDRQKAL